MKAPAKSSTVTEMQVLTSQELLVFSKPHKDAKVKGHVEEEATPMLQGQQKVMDTDAIEDPSSHAHVTVGSKAHVAVGTSIEADEQNASAVDNTEDDDMLKDIEEQLEAKMVSFDSEEKTTI